ncbi:hypothetical protein CC86DRAFT_390236 [Ophiobolus disseminans]|uniref:Uncharacterized protein n=1 Tax=Ophiobolus disseminans TaxID=1469910 RepID=A0A6A7AH95_9PLEO|nr:hypothetical protein CC86DRAFT_390236 [Ophiobolus disseminans]
MGRQAYLAKLAFGRSAFEPTQEATQSEDYLQLESAQADLPRQYQDFNGNNYIQLYDERGNPINPRSREYGKKLRNAQNDVLAAVGVVERRRSPCDGLPGSFEDQLDRLDVEDSIGDAIGATLTLTENVCTWWIGSIRNRVLTFRYHDAMPFARIVALEHAASGNSIVYTSFASTILATIISQTVLYNAFVRQPVTRLLKVTQATQGTRRLYRRLRDVLKSGLRVGLEIVFYPFYYHAELQRLGLIPARPLLPCWKSLIPFTKASPILPFSLYFSPSTSIMDCAKAAVTSPVVLMCVCHSIERWVYAAVNEAVDTSVIRPDNPAIVSPEAGNKHRITAILGLRGQSPPLVRKAINSLLVALGWGAPYDSNQAGQAHLPETTQHVNPTEGQTIEVGGTTVTDVTPLELAVAQIPGHIDVDVSDVQVVAMQASENDENERPRTPMTPMASELQYDDDDPRIRITNRQGIVEMEVRLPPRILSTHTEVDDDLVPPQSQGRVQSRREALGPTDRPQHRVSELSLEVSRMVSAIVKAQIVGLAMLPVKLVVLRLIASHYLACHGGSNSSRAVVPLPDLKDLSWRSVGIQVSRLALCNALEIAIDLTLWSLQYAIALNIGKARFGWGAL